MALDKIEENFKICDDPTIMFDCVIWGKLRRSEMVNFKHLWDDFNFIIDDMPEPLPNGIFMAYGRAKLDGLMLLCNQKWIHEVRHITEPKNCCSIDV